MTVLTLPPAPTHHFGEWLVLDEEAEFIRQEAELLNRRLNQLRTRYADIRAAQAELDGEEVAAA